MRRLEFTSVDPTPVSRVVMGDTVSLEKATKLFAKFMIAASSHRQRSITVIFAETKTTIASAIPGGDVPHTIEPLGPDSAVVLAVSAKFYCFPKMATAPHTVFPNVVSVAS
jgi:hypothetical protein